MKNPNYNPEFLAAYKESKDLEWISYIGQPMLYEAGLFVNRSKEDQARTDYYWSKQQSK